MPTEFTPVSALTGGVLIGVAVIMLMATVGRVAGISGITSRLLPPDVDRDSVPVSVSFLCGLLLAMPLYQQLTGTVPLQVVGEIGWIPVVAGLLVGYGTVTGNGCTSGHGICGVSRLSVRSIIATLIFITTAMITVWVQRHV